MALFPVGDNNPRDIYPITPAVDGTELLPIANKGTTLLYVSTGQIADFISPTGGAANQALSNLSPTAISASLLPGADGTLALGDGTHGWARLSLSSGATINAANGSAVITQSTGIWTVSAGDWRVTTAGADPTSVVTVGGTQTLTNKTLTSPAIAGGTINSAVIGDVTPAAGTFTTIAGSVTPTGATASRTLANHFADVVSVKDFGAVGDGVTNDTAAFAATLAAIGSGSAALYIPAGTYLLTPSTLAKTLSGNQSIKIYGDGTDSSILYFDATGNGLSFTFTTSSFSWIAGNNLIFEDLSFVSNVANPAGSAILIDGNCTIGNPNRPTVLNRVGFRGTATANSCWGVGAFITDLQNVEANDCYFFGSVLGVVGTGILYTGTSNAEHPTVLNVHNWQQQFGEVGIHCTNFVEGLNIVQSNFTQTNYGVLVDTNGALPMFSATGSQFNCNLVCIQLTDCTASQITGNLIFTNAASATAIVANGPYHTITGNTLISNAATCNGIILQSGATDCFIGDNVFKNFSTNIWLQAGANNNAIGDNRHADGTPLLDQGTGNLYGPRFEVGEGGSVTQATNKATGVTLNKRCGQITLNAASLAAGGATTVGIVSFTLTNNTISAGDVLVLNHISGGTSGAYTLNAQSAAGSAIINIRNNTTGALAEAIVIEFAVIKVVTH